VIDLRALPGLVVEPLLQPADPAEEVLAGCGCWPVSADVA